MDVPVSTVVRIRRTNKLAYPSNSEDFVARIIPLLKVACISKMKMEASNDFCTQYEIPCWLDPNQFRFHQVFCRGVPLHPLLQLLKNEKVLLRADPVQRFLL